MPYTETTMAVAPSTMVVVRCSRRTGQQTSQALPGTRRDSGTGGWSLPLPPTKLTMIMWPSSGSEVVAIEGKGRVVGDARARNRTAEEGDVIAPLVHSRKLNANMLAAEILHLRMRGKHEEANQLLREYQREMEAVLQDQGTSADEPMHEKGRSSIRHTIKHIAAEHRKGEENVDMHAANIIMRNKHYDMSRLVEDEYDDLGELPQGRVEMQETSLT